MGGVDLDHPAVNLKGRMKSNPILTVQNGCCDQGKVEGLQQFLFIDLEVEPEAGGFVSYC